MSENGKRIQTLSCHGEILELAFEDHFSNELEYIKISWMSVLFTKW